MKKKASWWQIALLIVFIIVLAFGAWQADAVGDHFQYLVLAPDQVVPDGTDGAAVKPNQPIVNAIEGLKNRVDEWETTMAGWTVGGVMERRRLTCDAGSATARVELMGENGLLLHPLYLREGRLFYPEELEKGEKVIILDEQLALKLFNYPYPVGRMASLEGISYRVIGIVRHTKRVGDLMDFGAYIPLLSVIDQYITVDALQVEAMPNHGTGANVSFRLAEQWGQEVIGKSGTSYDLGKESMGARLWLRVLLFVAGMTLCLRLIGWLNGRLRYYAKRYRLQLQRKYALALMPELIGVILLFAVGYGTAIGILTLMMIYIIEPVYTFPEWIPKILVEWEDIGKAFWSVWQTPAVMVELRTPEILRLHWLDLLIKGCSAGAAVLLALCYARSRTLADEMNDSLTGLYREGVLVSVLRTTRPIAMAELGYVPCEETGVWLPGPMHPRRHRRRSQSTPMMRVINAERILMQLPADKRDGTFVVEIVDSRIEQNNHRWQITCKDGEKTMKEVTRDWDLQLPIETLTRIVYGSQTFADFLESNAGYDMKMHSPAMDAMFDQQLPITPCAL